MANANRPPGIQSRLAWIGFGFSTPALLTGAVWYWYRKLWVPGTAIFLLLAVVACFPASGVDIPLSIAIAFGARQLYVLHAITKITALRVHAAQPDYLLVLSAAGGVSKTAAWLGGVLYVSLIGFDAYRILQTLVP